MDRISSMFNELEELKEKYAGYKYVMVSDLPYKEPENDEQRAKAKRLARNGSIVMIVVFAAFIATLVFSIISQSNFGVIALLAGLCILIGIICFKQFSRKVMISTGIAVYKHRERKRGSFRYYEYYITFVADGDEKVLTTRVRVNSKEYGQIVEGTRVMVVNRGYQACILNEG